MSKSVWVLTNEYNDYDQHGEYFVAVFGDPPTLENLSTFVTGYYVNDAYLKHVKAGGGRLEDEDVWWNLNEEKLL